MFCKNCGSELPNDAKFCPKCGNSIISQEPDTQYAPQTEPKVHQPEASATPPEAPVSRPQYQTTENAYGVAENNVPKYNTQGVRRNGSEPLKICCPECGSRNLQVLSNTNFTTTNEVKGYSGGKGCLGFFMFGPLGLLCGSCGNKSKQTVTATTTNCMVCKDCGENFLTPKQILDSIACSKPFSRKYLIKIGAIVLACLLIPFLLLKLITEVPSEVIGFFIGISLFFWAVLFIAILLQNSTRKRATAALEAEYRKTVEKMSRFQ